MGAQVWETACTEWGCREAKESGFYFVGDEIPLKKCVVEKAMQLAFTNDRKIPFPAQSLEYSRSSVNIR